MNWNRFQSLGSQKANGTKSTSSGFKPANSLQWRNDVASVRYRLMSTRWCPNTTFSNSGGNYIVMGLYKGTFQYKVSHFNCITGTTMAWSIISWDRDSRSSTNSNGKSPIQGEVSNNDHALCWCQQLLQVQFTFVFKKILEVEVI